jgi:succinoglycan biosynthesis protein ExoU
MAPIVPLSREAPDVTVVVAAWQARDTVARAVASALDQTDVAVEVIVVDDCSTDGTATAARAVAPGDARLRVFRQPKNLGPAAARNRALAAACAPWVTALDSDDFMEPGRLARLLAIAREERADLVADDLLRQRQDDPDGHARWRLWSDRDLGLQVLTAEAFVRGNLTSRHGGRRELGFVKPLMSLEFLRKHDLTYPDLRLGEDYALYARALVLGARFVLTDPLGYVAVVRDRSLSSEHPTSAHAALIAVDDALLAMTDDRGASAALRAHRREVYQEWVWRRMIDAVRASDPVAAAACFVAPPRVAAELARRLGADVAGRARRRCLDLLRLHAEPTQETACSENGRTHPERQRGATRQ